MSTPTSDENDALESVLACSDYTMSEPHLSGYRLIIGFGTMPELQAAHEAIANLRKKPTHVEVWRPMNQGTKPTLPSNERFIYCSQTATLCMSARCVATGICGFIADGCCTSDAETLARAREMNIALRVTPETNLCAKFRIGDDVVVTRWHAPAKVKGFIYELEDPFQYPERERDLSPPTQKACEQQPLKTVCQWEPIEEGSRCFNTCKPGEEFNLDDGCEPYPFCHWCGRPVVIP